MQFGKSKKERQESAVDAQREVEREAKLKVWAEEEAKCKQRLQQLSADAVGNL